MIIKRWTSDKKKYKLRRKKRGGVHMAVFAKPVNHPFIVDKEKASEFLQEKRDESVLQKIFAKAKMIEKNMIK